jgi:hypothetical protein
MDIKEWWLIMQDWMVRAENYLIWGMILVLGVVGMVMIWEALDDYRSFKKIIHFEEISAAEESFIKVLNLKITGISTGQDGTYFRYVTVGSISESIPLDERIVELEQSDGASAITRLESIPSFLVKEEHTSFWKTHFTLMFMFKYGGWIAFCIFCGIFAFVNLKQENKLLTKEIEHLIQGSFFIILIGVFVYDHVNIRMINFLNDEYQFSASAEALSSSQMYFVLSLLLLTYTIITKATQVQEEQDLTV